MTSWSRESWSRGNWSRENWSRGTESLYPGSHTTGFDSETISVYRYTRWIFRNTWQCMCVNFLSLPLLHEHTHTHHTLSLSLSLSHTNTHTLTLSHKHTHSPSLTRTHTLSLSHMNTLTLPSWWAASWSRGRQASWESGRRSSYRSHALFHHQCGAVSTFPSHPRFPPPPPPPCHLEHNHSRPMNPICQHIQQTERGREHGVTLTGKIHSFTLQQCWLFKAGGVWEEKGVVINAMGSFLCASWPYLIILLGTTELFQMTWRWQSEATVGNACPHNWYSN